MGLAFGTAAIVSFGKAALDAASDLQEVQNVVDTAFGDMAYKAEQFASTSIERFGMSEVAAKRAASTYMAMGKSMGLSMGAASDMAVAVAGLTGDVASFYNISQDLASIKLKGIWTGETEALKDLGVVMTEANLKEFALSKGITKNYQAMSQAEKVTLRYMYVSQTLSDAQGDFARTSTSYANQTRILAERFTQLKIAIGNAPLPIARAVLPGINAVIAGLTRLANVFAQVTALLFGKEMPQQISAQKGIAASGAAAADATGDMAKATEGAGKASKKAAKDLNGAVAGFDDLNVLASQAADGLGEVSSDLNGIGGGLDFGEIGTSGELFEGATIDPTLEKQIDGLTEKLRELAEAFQEGFRFGSGALDISPIENALEHIKKSISGIFGDAKVSTAAKRWIQSIAYSIGALTGSLASIGVSLATGLLGGVQKYLDENANRISEWLVRIFDVGAEINGMISSFSAALADVFSVFGGESAQSIVASVLQIFSNIFMTITELAQKFGRDMLNVITAPFIENKDQLKATFEAALSIIAEVMGTIADLVQVAVDKIVSVYDDHIHPFIMAVKDSFSEWFNHLLVGWNTYIKPVLDKLADKFDEVVKQHIAPMLEKAIELIGKVWDILKLLWENILSPFVTWIIDIAAPLVGVALDVLGTAFFVFFTVVSDVISKILDVLNGVLDFIVNIFTGEWGKALETLGNHIVRWVTDTWSHIEDLWDNAVKWLSDNVITPITEFFSTLWSTVSDLASKAWEGICGVWSAVSGWFSTAVIQPVQQFFEGLWTAVQTAAQACWTAVSGLWTTVSGWFNTNVVQPVSQFFSGLWTGISTWASDAWRNITDVFGKAADWFQSTIIDPVSNGFKGFFNGLIGFAEGFVNFFIRGINQLIGALNGMSFSAPDWVPFIGGKRFGLDIPSASELRLPRLANGAVIPPNSQFLAVLGDQRRGTNIEAPLSTIEQALRNVLASTGGQGGDVTVNFTIDLDSREIYRGQKRVSRQLGSGLVGGLA